MRLRAEAYRPHILQPISVRDDKTSGEPRIEAVITGKGGGQTFRTRQGVATLSQYARFMTRGAGPAAGDPP